MQDQTHGHVVMEMLISATEPYTRQSLQEALEAELGPNPIFYTCSDKDMNLDELLQFLAERGKLFEIDGQLSSDPALMCDHDH